MVTISKLVVYPLKGAKGIEVNAAKVTDTGISRKCMDGQGVMAMHVSSATRTLFRLIEVGVLPAGLAFDRHFVIVGDTDKGRFETQRSEPR